jgi:type I restriction enzyme S subunit
MNELTGQFPADWELLRLPEVLFFQEGPGITSDKFTKEGIPFINIRCFVNGRIDRSSCQFISQKLGNGEYKHFQLDVNDWVFSSSGTIGKIALIFDEDLPLLLNTSTIRFRTQDEKRLANNYIKFFLESFHFKIQHQLQTQGSAQVNVGPTHLQKMHIPLPPIKEQTQIATILSTIDRAIEQTEALIAKQQRIKTGLMQDLLTKGIDENGNIRSEETHEFKDSPLGRIPVEWEVKPLASVAEIIMGQSPQGYTYNQIGEGTPLINGPTEFGTRYIERVNQWTTSPTKLCKRGDVLFCVRGSTTGRINIANDVYCIGRGLAAIREVKNKSINSFLELFLTQLVEQLFSEASGSGSTFPSITSNRLSATLILVPSIEEQNQIVLIINSYDRHICTEETHLNKLHSLKTGLMQDLLTGKVRVIDLLNQKTAAN